MNVSAANTDLSLAHLGELDVPPAELIEVAATAGFQSVGLRMMPATAGGIEYPLRTAVEQADVRRRIAATGVTVLAVELISLTHAMDADACRRMIEAGANIGATRVVVSGDVPDLGLMAERMAEVCAWAKPYGMAVDIEFMPYRGVRSFGEAVDVVRRTGADNARILLDALHFARSGSAIEDVRQAGSGLIGAFQLCDAPLQAPPLADLPAEARGRRLLPGDGQLPLWPLIYALPEGTPISVEVPLGGVMPDATPVARSRRIVEKTRAFLENRRSA